MANARQWLLWPSTALKFTRAGHMQKGAKVTSSSQVTIETFCTLAAFECVINQSHKQIQIVSILAHPPTQIVTCKLRAIWATGKMMHESSVAKLYFHLTNRTKTC